MLTEYIVKQSVSLCCFEFDHSTRNSGFGEVRFTSTETIRAISDGETRTATSAFTQLLSSDGFGEGNCKLYCPECHCLVLIVSLATL